MVRAASPTAEERRAAKRAATNRKAVVISADAAMPLFTGTAFDISRDGVGIRAYSRMSKGAAVDLEIEPRPDHEGDSLIRLSGYVVRCEPSGPHEYALGIQYRVHAPFRTMPDARRVLAVRRAPVLVPERQLPERRRRGIAPWLAVLAAALLFLLWWPLDESGATAPHRSDRRLAGEHDERAPEKIPPSTGERGRSTATSQPVPKVLAHGSLPFGNLVGGGRPGPAELEGLSGMGGPGEFVDFDEALEGGDPGGTARIANAMRMLSGRGEDGGSTFASAVPMSKAIDRVREPLANSESRNATAYLPQEERQSPVQLMVDRDAFEMTVYVDGKSLWKFPVGLGKDDSTPSGEFTIHNKIAQPDWYHRGESVPYGHPRNPLGESWMGLASNGTPLSYGIHPTKETDSIGTANGAGCIRLRPEDAEKLFRFCPIGATVRIASSR